MNTATISNVKLQPPSFTFEDAKNWCGKSVKKLDASRDYLIPTISAAALGILCIPNFSFGIAAGVGLLASAVILNEVFSVLGFEEEEINSKYEKLLLENPLSVTLVLPVAEEVVFRGVLQPTVQVAIQVLSPVATTLVFSALGINAAALGAIAVTSVFFGAAHYFNDHKNSGLQAVNATLAGAFLGVLSARFGLGCAIAAHITNNTLSLTYLKHKANAV